MPAVRIPPGVKLGLLLLAAVALQALVTSRLAILGVTPDVFLILVVVVALGRGSVTGALFGFAGGLLADVVFLDPVGLRTFVYLVAGYGVGRYSEELGLVNAWMLVLLAGCVALVSQGVYGLLQFVLGWDGSLLAMVRTQILPAALLDGLLAAPVYLGLVRLRCLPPLEGANPSFRSV